MAGSGWRVQESDGPADPAPRRGGGGRGALAVVLAAFIQSAPAVAQGPVAATTIPPAAIDEALEITGESLRARREETRMSLPVLIDGRGPFRFVVDSGADRSVIGRNLAARLGLAPGEPVRMVSIVDVTVVPTARVARLDIGDSALSDFEMPALAERDLGLEGLIGIDALAEQRLMLDFERNTVTIEDARHRVPRLAGDITVTARRRNGQLIIAQAEAVGRRVMAVIDTGAAVTVGNLALRERIFGGRHPPRVRTSELIGVTGAKLTVSTATLPELRVGTLVLRDVTVVFADLPPFARFGLADEPSLLLGTDVLRAFARVSLDFKRRKVRFQLRRQSGPGVLLR